MKKNKKGFALAETLIVSTVVAGILIYIFIQFTVLKRNYNLSFKYNTVNDLYALEDVTEYIYNLDRNVINEYILETINEEGYLRVYKNDLYEDNSNSTYNVFSINSDTNILNVLDINELVITKEDISSLDTSEISPKLVQFIKKLKNSSGNKNRIIARFNDDTFASLVIDLGVE